MSIKIFPGQTTVIYPPEPGTEQGPLHGPCSHLDCRTMRRDAEVLCPYCQQPLGFGCVMYVTETNAMHKGVPAKTGGGTLTMAHASCYEAAHVSTQPEDTAPKEG